MITIGIDIGSVCAKAAAYDGENMYMLMRPTGWNLREAGEELYRKVLDKSGGQESDVAAIIGTGYGRVSIPFATKRVTEITCHARGAIYLNPQARTIIDVGGQDSKAISIDEKGNVLDFIMNDKCAAGTGRFLQVMSHILEAEVDELEELAAQSAPRDINSMCAVFAESEVISLLASGATKASIASGILHSISNKIAHIANRIKIRDLVLFTGGVSKNDQIRTILQKKMNCSIYSHGDSQYAGAIGAALIGYRA
ncbi:acyl-CoA dehydratase activase [Lutispora sp.]|uniref:acyl-CoA dehydratase activase n=1 Tax=Lutispora sp. TaxID=2828727 RepID=UPI002B209B72|nr:acyl-CoA dehydratase activase [Lutispora sp.]MEA4960940.1 acyl-CoA dehydratase activase [Lutispora sp.]